MVKNTHDAEDGTAYTTVPAQASLANDVEFVDAPRLYSGWGIKRSLAYSLLGAGLIRGCSLRRRGQTKGKRLFEVASVRAYLASQMEDGK